MTAVAIIGDIHGCAVELGELLERVGRRRIVSLGDVIDRGPDPLVCIRLLRDIGADVVLGNHEERLFRSGEPAGDNDARWLQSRCVPYLRLEDHGVVAVHAGLHAGLAPEAHRRDAICRVGLTRPGCRDRHSPWASWRRAGDGSPEMHGPEVAQATIEGFRWWSELLPAAGPIVVYGHTVVPAPLLTSRDGMRPRHVFADNDTVTTKHLMAVGIDTGVVFGGALTALLLPEWRLVRVAAHRRWYLGGERE